MIHGYHLSSWVGNGHTDRKTYKTDSKGDCWPSQALAVLPHTSVVLVVVVVFLQKSRTPLSYHFAWLLKTATGDNEFQPDLGWMEGGPPQVKWEDGRQKRRGRESCRLLSLRNVPREMDGGEIDSLKTAHALWPLKSSWDPGNTCWTWGQLHKAHKPLHLQQRIAGDAFLSEQTGKQEETSAKLWMRSQILLLTAWGKWELTGMLKEMALCHGERWPWLSPARVWIRVLLSGFVIHTLTRVKSALYSGSVSYLKQQVFLQRSSSMKPHDWGRGGAP